MLTRDVLAIVGLIFVGIAALKFLGDPRFKHPAPQKKEGFVNPDKVDPVGADTRTFLNPDVKKEGPAHLLNPTIESTRPYNEFGTLTQQQCYEQDGNRLADLLSDYNQRTNNYKHTYPDSCSAPFKELNGACYAPREGSIGAPIPFGTKYPVSSTCLYAQ